MRRAIWGDVDPYAGIDLERFPRDVQGWGWNSPVFRYVVHHYRPMLWIEIGTWKGASALNTAKLLKHYKIDGAQVICVDTWLRPPNGDQPVGDSEQPFVLVPGHGHYDTFVANVLHDGHADIIVPVPVESLIAARFFCDRQIQADVIYIDATHTYDTVSADLVAWWEVLKPGGVMIGDDYGGHHFPEVKPAVDRFAAARALKVASRFSGKFLLEKPV